MNSERRQQARQFVDKVRALESEYGFRRVWNSEAGEGELFGVAVESYEDGSPSKMVLVEDVSQPLPKDGGTPSLLARSVERNSMSQSPYEEYLAYLRTRIQTVNTDSNLTRSARATSIAELQNAAVQFITMFQLMSVVQPGPSQRHRRATEEEVRARVACCLHGISVERFVADMVDCGIEEEQAWDAATAAEHTDAELWGMTFAEAIRAAGPLGVPYAPGTAP